VIFTALLALAVPYLLGAAGAVLKKPWSAPLGAATGYLAGHIIVAGMPPLPPVETTQWIPVFAAAGGVVAFLEADIEPRLATVWKYRLVALSGAVWITLRPLTRSSWTTGVSVAWSLGFLALGLVLAACADLLAKRTSSLDRTAVFAASAGTAAVTLALSGSALLGQLAAAAAAALAGIAVIQIVQKTETAAALTAAVYLPLSAIVANGCFYANLSRAGAVLLLAAPAVPYLVSLRLPESLAGLKRTAVLVAAAAAPGLVALGIALANQPAPGTDY